MKRYKVSYSIDYLDPKPTVKYFDEWHEMQQWIDEEVQNRIDYTVEHSIYQITEKKLEQIEEYQYSLITAEDTKCKLMKLQKI